MSNYVQAGCASGIGERRLIVVGLLCSGFGYGLMSFAASAVLVGLCLVVVGVGTALHHAPSSALIATRYSAGTRSSALGLYNASGDVGKLSFTALFSLAIGLGFAWQQVSIVYSAISALVAVGCYPDGATVYDQRIKLRQQPTVNGCENTSSWLGNTELEGVLGALLVVTSVDTLVQSSVMVFVAFLMIEKGLSVPFAIGTTVLLLFGGVFGQGWLWIPC